MMKDQRADAGFGVHHEAFGKLHPDFFRLEQLPDAGLIFQVGARRITKAVALAAIARSESLRHGHLGGIGEAPVFADPAMQPFGAALRRFDSQGLQAVAEKIIPFVFCLFGALTDTFTCCNNKECEVVAAAALRGEDIIAQAKELALALPRKKEGM